jgi:predicted PolB exonuclease-like 3'-5' exonuclease
MLEEIDIKKVLFLDIETVPSAPAYSALSSPLQQLWDKKAKMLRKNEEETAEELYGRAGIYAEFGKIVCVSSGIIHSSDNEKHLRLVSFYGDDEKRILEDFSTLLSNHFNTNSHYLCAHNGKEFDFPYLARRMLINGVQIPKALDLAGKKPWEVRHLDTMELWKFGDYKNFTSLELLTTLFDIPTPKDDMEGSQVKVVYWKERNLERIVTYCQKDVVALAQLFLKYKREELVKEQNITYT